jgi:hypothetical protein
MSIKVIPKFILKKYMNERDWAQLDHEEDTRTLRQYTAQNEDFPEDALIHKVKELLETLVKNNNFEGQTKVTVDNNREKYTVIREGTTEAEFKKLVKDFNENEGSILEDENAHFGIGYIYLDIVPGSYNANMMEGGSRKSKSKKSKSKKSKSKKSKSKKSRSKKSKGKKRHTKRKC